MKKKNYLVYIVLVIFLVVLGFILWKINKDRNPSKIENLSNAYDLYQKGRDYASQSNYTEAVAYYEKATKADPDSQIYIQELAISYYNAGKYDEAINEYEKLIDRNPKDAALYNNLANVYRDKKDDGKASEYYQKAVDVNVNFIAGYNNYALMLQSLGKFDEAKDVLNNGLKHNPDNRELKITLENIK